MLNILIVDDEKNIRIGIKKMLNLIDPNYSVVGEANSIKEAKSVLLKCKPDILLLDIELKDGTGFELLDQLDTISFKVIFITAFNQYAIKAFKFNALDYLLKPVDPNELKTALEKAKAGIKSENELKELIKNVEHNNNNHNPKIVIKTTDRTHFIPIDSIIYCKSDGAYTKIFTTDTLVFASKNLKHFQELLDGYSFIRTHQSYLVNKNFVTDLRNDVIYLTDNIQIPISIRKKASIKTLLLNK